MLPEGLGNAIHLLAAVIWVGGLAVLVFALRPALRRSVPADVERDRILSAVHRRFAALATVAAAVLFASGFMMMATDEHFLGFGHYGNTWSKLMVGKHALFLGMLGILVLLRVPRPSKSEHDLVDVSLMLGLAVLVVTGLLTAVV